MKDTQKRLTGLRGGGGWEETLQDSMVDTTRYLNHKYVDKEEDVKFVELLVLIVKKKNKGPGSYHGRILITNYL